MTSSLKGEGVGPAEIWQIDDAGIPGWPQFESGLTAGWLAQAGSHSARYSEHQNTEDYGLHIFTLQFLFTAIGYITVFLIPSSSSNTCMASRILGTPPWEPRASRVNSSDKVAPSPHGSISTSWIIWIKLTSVYGFLLPHPTPWFVVFLALLRTLPDSQISRLGQILFVMDWAWYFSLD